DSRRLNWTALAEAVGGVLITQLGLFQRWLGTTDLLPRETGLAVLAAGLLLGPLEVGQLIAPRRGDRVGPARGTGRGGSMCPPRGVMRGHPGRNEYRGVAPPRVARSSKGGANGHPHGVEVSDRHRRRAGAHEAR